MKGPSIMFTDNLAVVSSSAIPDNTLKKRHNALSYHRVREAIVAKIIKFYHIDGKENPADVLTKFLDSKTWWHLLKPILHWPKDEDDGDPTRDQNYKSYNFGSDANANAYATPIDAGI